MGAVQMVQGVMGVPIPIALHLDHGDSFELCEVLHRHRLLLGHDRRLRPALRRERRADPQGGGVRPQARRHRGGRAGGAGRHRGRGVARGLALHQARGGRGLREEDRRGQPGHLHRHHPRRLQVQGQARRAAPAAALRHPGGGRAAHPGLPHRAARRLLGDPGVRGDDQQVRRQDGRTPSASPRSSCAAPPSPRSARSTSTPTAGWR